MEVGLAEKCTWEIREPIIVSRSIPSGRELKTIEVVTDGDKKVAEETCEHFTIRGFVADVRKENKNICWPFSMMRNHKSDEYADLLPPLHVTKFCRWNCENCLRVTDASAAIVFSRILVHSQSDGGQGITTSLHGSTILPSLSDEKILLPAYHQPSEGRMVREHLLIEDSCINASNGESRPSVFPPKKENEFLIKHPTGFDIPNASPDNCEEIRNQPSDVPSFISTNTLETACGEGVSGQKENVDLTGSVQDIDSMELGENEQDASSNDRELSTAYKRFPRKKARKVRLLNDIMRSAGCDPLPKEVSVPSESTEDGRSNDDNDKRPDTCKVKTQVEPSKSRTRYIVLENGDEGPSFLYWLKRARKKVMTNKGYTESSKQSADASAGKPSDLTHKVSGIKGKKSLQRKKNKMPWQSLMPQQEVMKGKDISVAKDAAINYIHGRTTDSKFKGLIFTPQTLHHCPNIRHHSSKKASMSKKKSKVPQVEVSESTQMQSSKDSFGKHAHENTSAFQEPRNVPKKKRTARVSKKEDLDGIAMDIIELLAKNRRRMMDAEAATIMLNKSSEAPKTLSIRSHRDMNNQESTVASTWIPAQPECRIQSISCSQTPNSISTNNYFTENYSWNRGRMPTQDSCRIDNRVYSQNLGRNSLGLSSALSDGVPFKSKPQNDNYALSHQQGKRENSKSMNKDTHHLLQNKHRAESSIHKRDLYANEILPALHLLKHMDSATQSGVSPYQSLAVDESGFNPKFDFYSNDRCYEMAGLTIKHPMTVEHSFKGQYGHSCKPLRPVPRIGAFGSLVQKEIAPRTNNYGEIGHSSKLKSHATGKEKFHSAFSRNENIRHPSNIRRTQYGVKVRNSNYPKPCKSKEKEKSECSRSEGTFQSPKMETCVINRNPADFTILDEDNEYMRECEDPRPTKSNARKRQKVMKLTA